MVRRVVAKKPVVQLACEQVHRCGAKHAPRLDQTELFRFEASLVLADLVLPGQQVSYHVAFSREVEGSDRDKVS